MRGLKLRAKTTDGEWVYGTLCMNGVIPPHIVWVRKDAEVITTDIFQYETIGMYSRLHDKNGTEIFDGDIVHFVNPGLRYDMTVPVVFNRGDFCLEKNRNYLIPMGNFEDACYEVVGNIFDNPELLNK